MARYYISRMNSLNFEHDDHVYGIRYIMDKEGSPWFSAYDTIQCCGYKRPRDVHQIRYSSQKKMLSEIVDKIPTNEHPSSIYMSIWDVQQVLGRFDSPVTEYFRNKIERLCRDAFLTQQESTVQISNLQQSIEVHQRQLSEAAVQITNLQQLVEAHQRQISEQLAVVDRIIAHYRRIVTERCISHLRDTTKANKIVILKKNVETRYPCYCIRGQRSYVDHRLSVLRRVYPNMEVIVNVHKPAGVNFYNFLKEVQVVQHSGNDVALTVPQNVFIAIIERMDQVEVEMLLQLQEAERPQQQQQ